MEDSVPITLVTGEEPVRIDAHRGRLLRDVLLDAGYSPYTSLTERANCGGRGLCATCGVRIEEGSSSPDHWHDQLADRFGYPRLSCQVRVDGPLTIRIPDKRIWGGRE